jgi:tetratricopeptide (TPR) repeat protein
MWCHAFEILTYVASHHPEIIGLQKRRSDCANDLAWFLLNESDPTVRNPLMAVELATQATEADAGCAAYWNTLGAAYYTAGNAANAIAALERSVNLTGGGTAFDFIFLALSYGQLGNPEQARYWGAQATLWIEQQGCDHPDLFRLYQQARFSLSSV